MTVEGLCEDVNNSCDSEGRTDISGGVCPGNERLHFREGEGANQVLLLCVRLDWEGNNCEGGNSDVTPEVSSTSGSRGGRGRRSESDLYLYIKCYI